MTSAVARSSTVAIVLRSVPLFCVTLGTDALGFALPTLGAQLARPLLSSGIAVGAVNVAAAAAMLVFQRAAVPVTDLHAHDASSGRRDRRAASG